MNNLDLLIPQRLDREKSGWATITQLSPLRIRLDGETSALSFAPDTLTGGLAVDDRVLVALTTNDDPNFRARRLVIVGKAGGMEDALDARITDLESATLAEEDPQNTSGTTTSTSYTSTLSGGGATACGIAFTAPASGKVMVHSHSRVVNSSSSFAAFCCFHVREGSSIGSGTDFLVPADTFAFYHTGVSAMRGGNAKLVTGLTPGASYNVQHAYRVDGGTGTFSDKNLTVEGK